MAGPEDAPPQDEFAVIARWFAPLAADPAARGLLDDAAVLARPAGDLVLTCDAIVEGVHFLPEDPIDTVAQKALRVNLSDLAAKAAAPVGYLLTLAWPRARPASQIEALAAGLKRDQAAFGLALLGGDTVSTPGPLTLSITMLGAPVGARAPSRAEARAGDDVWVSGSIGDGYLGLEAARGGLSALSPDQRAWLAQRYRTPDPRLSLAALLAAQAHAAMDVSDGLLADAAKLAAASGVGVEIEAARVPLSPAARAWLQDQGEAALMALLTGGDDYEILFTASSERAEAISRDAAIPLTRIGRITPEPGLGLRGVDGVVRPASAGGFSHRLGG